MKFGFIRETTEKAIKAGIDKDTGICRTGLNDYLKAIFPNIDDWVHDKLIPNATINGKKVKTRPDYRSEELELIVEFDGVPHYQSPIVVREDVRKTNDYIRLGYKVVRVPFFIYLNKYAVKTLFGVDMNEDLFKHKVSSISIKQGTTPMFFCPAGAKRMCEEFARFQDQLKVNIDYLESLNAEEELTGVSMLKKYLE